MSIFRKIKKGLNKVFGKVIITDERTHTVQVGDTLWDISKTYYGDPTMYMKIYEANRPMLKDPDEIFPGQLLIIPTLHHDNKK